VLVEEGARLLLYVVEQLAQGLRRDVRARRLRSRQLAEEPRLLGIR
jgi:hypothetical protein